MINKNEWNKCKNDVEYFKKYLIICNNLNIIYAIWNTIFFDNISVGWVDSSWKNAKLIKKDYIKYYKTLPDFFKYKLLINNAECVELENNSSFVVTTKTPYTFAGFKLNTLILNNTDNYNTDTIVNIVNNSKCGKVIRVNNIFSGK